jgi:hypothetical protein
VVPKEVFRFLAVPARSIKAHGRISRNRNGQASDATVPAAFSLQNITQASINAEIGHSFRRATPRLRCQETITGVAAIS